MSQEYTEDRDVTLRKVSSGYRLLETLLILVSLFAIYLMVALLSFDPSDPSWSQTAWHEPIHNLGGVPGAWFADTLFFIFGVMAYTIPPIILGACWFTFCNRGRQDYIDYFALSLRLIGILAIVLTSCGLAAINADDIWYFASGGVIGSLLSTAMMPLLHSSGGTIALLCVWGAGLTLFTGWSWVNIAEKIGSITLSILTLASHRNHRDNTWQDEDSDEYNTGFAAENAYRKGRRTRILRSVLARRKRVSEKFVNPYGRKTDVALFSGKRVDDTEEEGIAFSPSAADASDVLFSRHKVSQPDEFDPLLSGYSITKGQDPHPISDTPVFAPSPEFETVDDVKTLNGGPDIAENNSEFSPQLPVTEMPSHATGGVDTNTVQSPVEKRPQARPVLYHFEEAEAQRAREHEQLAAWHQPESFDSGERAKHNNVPSTRPTAVEKTTISEPPFLPADTGDEGFTPAFSVADNAPRPQVKEGIGPKLPRPNRVRVPTRRELASYGIKLPSQRMAEERAKKAGRHENGIHYDEIKNVSHQEQANQFSTPPHHYDDSLLRHPETIMDEDAKSQAELAHQFSVSQQQRYGTQLLHDPESVMDEDAENQAELARQFSASQQQRYGTQPLHNQDVIKDGYAINQTSRQPIASASQAANPAMQQGNTTAYRPAEQTSSYVQQPLTPASQAADPAMQQGNTTAYRPAELTSPYVQQPVTPAVQPQVMPTEQETLLHPFLMRNGDNRPLQKPTTPLPSLDLLTSPPAEIEPIDTFALEQMARLVEARLADYRIKADVVDYSPGPVITRFELDLAPGVKAARISNLSRDLARSLSTVAVRVVEVIPGKPYVGLELPNKKRQTVYLREVLDCAKFRESPSPLTVVLGKDIGGDPVIADLGKMPHLLVAGTTGSGKSVGVNAMILSMLYKATPEEVRFIMIDPKMLELSVYEGIPHLLTEVVTDMKDAANALRWSVNEMERRYKLMSALGVRNLAGYNERVLEAERMGRPIPDPFWKPGDSMDISHPVLEKLPYIVVLVDEFADLMMTVGKKVEELIARLAQKARAAGIHLVLATQRPSVDVITGLIKANIPTRIAFTVSSKIDSRTILDQGGAESLLGMGDMLYSAPNSTIPVRVHGAFVRDQEVHAVVQDWKARGRPQYISGITSDNSAEGGSGGFDGEEELDPLFDQAVTFVVEKRKASISGVQRQFRIGYNRAARIVEQMEVQGIVSPQGHNGNREVLAPPPFE